MPYKDQAMKSQRQKERRKGEAPAILKPQSEAPMKPLKTIDTEKAAKLLLICNALDKEVIGLDGKKVNLLSMVRYGVNGPTLEKVKIQLN